MSVIEEGIYKLPEQKVQESPSSSPKTFFWDRIIASLAFAIFGLSISGIIFDFLKSDESSLACFSEFENRSQYTYINRYCRKDLPREEYFTLVLVGQAVLLVLPHYFWNVIFSTEFDSILSHIAKIEMLRKGSTGTYPHQNYRMVSFLQREYGSRKNILIAYLLKLGVQFGLVIVMIVVNAAVFTEINTDIRFECTDDEEDYQVFGSVTCADPKKLFINIIKGTDYGLLGLTFFVLAFGIYWCIRCYRLKEPDYEETAKVCYDSCIDPQYCYKPSKILSPLNLFQMNDDFTFLLASLNFGLRRVCITILIEHIISKEFGEHLQKFTQGNYVRSCIAEVTYHNYNVAVENFGGMDCSQKYFGGQRVFAQSTLPSNQLG